MTSYSRLSDVWEQFTC